MLPSFTLVGWLRPWRLAAVTLAVLALFLVQPTRRMPLSGPSSR